MSAKSAIKDHMRGFIRQRQQTDKDLKSARTLGITEHEIDMTVAVHNRQLEANYASAKTIEYLRDYQVLVKALPINVVDDKEVEAVEFEIKELKYELACMGQFQYPFRTATSLMCMLSLAPPLSQGEPHDEAGAINALKDVIRESPWVATALGLEGFSDEIITRIQGKHARLARSMRNLDDRYTHLPEKAVTEAKNQILSYQALKKIEKPLRDRDYQAAQAYTDIQDLLSREQRKEKLANQWRAELKGIRWQMAEVKNQIQGHKGVLMDGVESLQQAYKAAILDRDTEAVRLEAQLSRAHITSDHLRTEVEAFKKQVRGQNTTILARDAELINVRADMSRAQITLGNLRTDVEAIREQVRGQKTTILARNAELTNVRADMSRAQIKSGGLRTDLHAMKEQVQKQKSDMMEAVHSVGKACRAAVLATNTEAVRLGAQVSRAQTISGNLRTEIETLTEQVRGQRAAILVRDAQMRQALIANGPDVLRTSIQRVKDEVNQFSTDHTEDIGRIRQYITALVETSTKQHTQSPSTIGRQNQELGEARARVAELEGQCGQKDKALKEVNEKINGARTKATQLEEQCGVKEKALKEVNEEMNGARAKATRLETQYTKKESALNKEKNELIQALTDCLIGPSSFAIAGNSPVFFYSRLSIERMHMLKSRSWDLSSSDCLNFSNSVLSEDTHLVIDRKEDVLIPRKQQESTASLHRLGHNDIQSLDIILGCDIILRFQPHIPIHPLTLQTIESCTTRAVVEWMGSFFTAHIRRYQKMSTSKVASRGWGVEVWMGTIEEHVAGEGYG